MKCFYHNDMDGRCAGSLVAYYTDNYEQDSYYEVDYRNPLPIDKVEIGEVVYIVDYSFTDNTVGVLAELLKLNCKIVWIDHHSSSIRQCNTHDWVNSLNGIRDESRSGAYLTYQYFSKCKDDEDVPEFIKLVDDYDRWIFKYNNDTDFFKLSVDSMKNGPLSDLWKTLLFQAICFKHNSELLNSIISSGAAIYDYIQVTNAEHLSSYGYESEILNHKCFVMNRRSNSQLFGDKINEYPIVATWVFDGSQYTYSLYSSNPDVDCSKIAEHFGGGGHKGAAGFHSNTLIFTAHK